MEHDRSDEKGHLRCVVGNERGTKYGQVPRVTKCKVTPDEAHLIVKTWAT